MDTTGEHLLPVENIRDLASQDEEQGLIWNALRDCSNSIAQYSNKGEEKVKIDPGFSPFIKGWWGPNTRRSN